MNHVFTILAFALMSSVSAQTVLPPNYPYNPDSDGDEFVAVSDVLMSVASYDNEFQVQSIMVDTLSLEEAIQILLQQQSLNQEALIQSQQALIQSQQDLIDGLSNSLAGVEGFEPCLLNWTCGCPLTYQGYDYETVQIGEQCWFAENLRSDSYENGEQIPSNLTNAEWEATTVGAVAIFGEGSGNCFEQSVEGDACDEVWSLEEYGRLYNWFAVEDARGLCPNGWVVPSDDNWTTMTDLLGGMLVAGDAIKSVTGWPEISTGTDLSGFSGLPGGYRYWDGTFDNAGGFGSWWSSTPAGSSAWFRYVLGWSSEIMGPAWDKRYGYSVRCIQDSQ